LKGKKKKKMRCPFDLPSLLYIDISDKDPTAFPGAKGNFIFQDKEKKKGKLGKF
jgi:hypothetical protein